MKPNKIVVELTAEQSRVFEVLAGKIGARVGDVVLALACERTVANPGFSDEWPDHALRALCWLYVQERKAPNPYQWLCDKDMDRHFPGVGADPNYLPT